MTCRRKITKLIKLLLILFFYNSFSLQHFLLKILPIPLILLFKIKLTKLVIFKIYFLSYFIKSIFNYIELTLNEIDSRTFSKASVVSSEVRQAISCSLAARLILNPSFLAVFFLAAVFITISTSPL